MIANHDHKDDNEDDDDDDDDKSDDGCGQTRLYLDWVGFKLQHDISVHLLNIFQHNTYLYT